MKLESQNLDDYLKATPVIDFENPAVSGRARQLTRILTDDASQAKALFEWVRDEIPHSRDIGAKAVTCSASDVLLQGTGICYAKSHLLAALCRAKNIPAGFCYQVFQRKGYKGLGLHGLNALYLESSDQWIRLDARGNTGTIDAQFSLGEERLAFPVDPTKGELFIYDTIFTDPDPGVVSYLNQFENLDEAWGDLPSDISRED